MKKKLPIIIPMTIGCLLAVANMSPLKANAPTGYGLFIGGVEFTDENLVIDNSDSTNITAGSATFDATTNTLTLDNFKIDSPAYRDIGVNSYYYVIAYEGTDLLNVHLKNNNSVTSTAPDNNQHAYALYSNAALTITGSEGSSGNFTGPARSYDNYGIYSKGDLTINTEGSIDATSRVGTDTSQYNNIGESASIRSEGNILISSGTITCFAGESNGYSYGIFADTNSRTITIEGGTVTAYSSTCKYTNAGAMAKYFVMNDGDVTMIAGDSQSGYSCGIFGVSGAIYKKGNLTAAGNTYAINGSYFRNDINGIGWTDFDGTEGKANVAVNSSSNAISSFKRLVFPGKESITPVVSMSGYTYGGTVSTPSISGNTGEGKVTYYYNTTNSTTGGIEWKGITATSLNAGTYYMYAVVDETEQYSGATSATVSFKITKADVTLTAPTGVQNLSYKGSALTLVSGGEVEHGTILYKVNGGEYSTGLPAATNVGTYTVYYKVVGDTNYNDIAEASLEVTISANDKTSLSLALREANDYYNSIVADYPEIANTLQTAITNASNVYDNDNVTTKEISDAVAALNTALNNAKASISDHKKAEAVEDLIDAIGKVAFTTDCKDRIDKARTAYDALSADQKALVENYDDLTIAEARYNELKAAYDNATTVVEKIDAIGTVTYPDSNDKITEARAAYDALTTDDERGFVNNYSTLTAAETEYQNQKITGANNVKNKIDAIGKVAFTTDCKDRIDEARAAYDALSADQKALVENYATLVEAEETYADLASKGKTEIVDEDNEVSIETTDGTTISENIELKVEVRSSVTAKESDADYEKIKAVLEKDEEISKVYDVKLIRIVDGVETEIQPSDIKEGATIKVTMTLPSDIKTTNFRLLHIHSADDVEFVSGYTLENNELSFNINRLSEFAFIIKVDANGGLPGWAIALIIVGAILVTCCLVFFLLFFVFNKWIKDENDENKALRVFKCGMKEGKVRLLRPSFKLVYREKEEVYKTKKEALDK